MKDLLRLALVECLEIVKVSRFLNVMVKPALLLDQVVNLLTPAERHLGCFLRKNRGARLLQAQNLPFVELGSQFLVSKCHLMGGRAFRLESSIDLVRSGKVKRVLKVFIFDLDDLIALPDYSVKLMLQLLTLHVLPALKESRGVIVLILLTLDDPLIVIVAVQVVLLTGRLVILVLLKSPIAVGPLLPTNSFVIESRAMLLPLNLKHSLEGTLRGLDVELRIDAFAEFASVD